jgi:hypothetical protein
LPIYLPTSPSIRRPFVLFSHAFSLGITSLIRFFPPFSSHDLRLSTRSPHTTFYIPQLPFLPPSLPSAPSPSPLLRNHWERENTWFILVDYLSFDNYQGWFCIIRKRNFLALTSSQQARRANVRILLSHASFFAMPLSDRYSCESYTCVQYHSILQYPSLFPLSICMILLNSIPLSLIPGHGRRSRSGKIRIRVISARISCSTQQWTPSFWSLTFHCINLLRICPLVRLRIRHVFSPAMKPS